MSWRYQPVYQETDGYRVYSVIEAYFTDDALTMWSGAFDEDAARGDSIEELRHDLARMLLAAVKWEPVNYATLHAGQIFVCRAMAADVDVLAAELQTVMQQTEP